MPTVPLPDFKPVLKSFTAIDRERILMDVYKSMMDEYVRPMERTMFMYGNPARSDINTFEQFVKSSGLALYRADIPDIEPYIRHLYRVVTGLHPTGELGLLDIFLQILFPEQYDIVRLWHRTDPAIPYPSGILESEIVGESFLTSRVNVYLDGESLNSPFAGRVIGALRAVVGFEIVLNIFLKGEAIPEDLAYAAVVSPFMVLGIEDLDTVAQLGSYTT